MSKTQFYLQRMKINLAHILVFFFICGIYNTSIAQNYSLKISPATFTLDGQNFGGYSTSFVQPYREVKKEWWRYINARTIIFNKKTHLELTIPARGKDTNEPLKFVSQLNEIKNKKQSVLKMALMSDGVPADQLAELKKQAQFLMKDFKVNYFTGLIQEKIDEQELLSKKISLQMDKYLLDNSKLQLQIERKPEEKNELAKQLTTNTAEVEKLQIQLNQNQKILNQFKKELTLIK